MKPAWLLRDGEVLCALEVTESREERMVGLLNRDGIEGAILIRPARSVHSVGMAFPLDVAFCTKDLVVLRTMSKWAGLAGLRIGYGVFPRYVAEQLWKVKPPFNVNQAALVAVEASLDDVEYLHGTLSRIRAERNRMFRKIKRLEYLTPYPSHGNFFLCKVIRGNAHDVHLRLADRGIMVRAYGDGLLRDYLRISVGKPEDTDRLMTALQTIGAHV